MDAARVADIFLIKKETQGICKNYALSIAIENYSDNYVSFIRFKWYMFQLLWIF